ncbi:MAG: 3-oxoacyl-[acyl-carrier-protein] synthase II [Rhodothermales bacterium]|jgi:3-oxoacyl-[acyl-carrier-protein] synthase II
MFIPQSSRRIVITGIGAVAPNGIGHHAFWNGILRRESAIRRITRFDASQLKTQIAGEVPDFDPSIYLEGVKTKRAARHTQFALVASQLALEDAELHPQACRPDFAVPVILGVSTSAFDVIQKGSQHVPTRGPDAASGFLITESLPQAAASAVCRLLAVDTAASTISSACPSGLDAVAAAFLQLREGVGEFAICGGTDSPLTLVPFANFANAGLASMRNDQPERASRPFDRERDSGVISEGAGVLVLETLRHALARGARPYAEITGFSSCNDPEPGEHGAGLADSMRRAVANAGRRNSAVDYISAHGPGHPVLDRVETEMIKRTFGSRAYRLPVSSIKGAIGNPLAAAGPLQVIATARCLHEQVIPPTANLEVPDPECDLDYVASGPRRAKVSCALVNSHGVGGGNSSLVLERYSP